MNCIEVFLFLCVLFFQCVCSLDEFEKYEQIINEELQNAKTYTMPTENSEFIANPDNIKDAGVFDFIVVGTGAAGGVIANGLAQVKKWRMLIIEAGTQRNDFVDIPGMSLNLVNTQYNWNYKSKPLKHSGYGNKDRRISMNRGKGLGGNTLINGLRYVRGSKYDWDQMVMDGNPGWSYTNMLPYMKKIENSHLRYEDAGYHGHSGPINVEHYNGTYPQFEMMIEAHKEVGYPQVDINGKSQLGITHSPLMSRRGKRCSTGSAFIDPIKNNTNVVISEKSLAIKVIVNENTKIAEGIIFSKNNQLYSAKATKEVILCAGAIGTSQLLLLSEIGPVEELKKHSIKVIHELPVGQNVLDHPVFHNAIFINTNSFIAKQELSEYIRQYAEGYGPLTIANGMQGLAFFKTKFTANKEGADIACNYVPPTPTVNREDKEGSALLPEVFDALYKNVNFSTAIAIYVLLLKPKSKGSITLKSASPYNYPIIDVNHFDDTHDMKTMLEGISIISQLENTKAFKKYNAIMAPFHLPVCKKFIYRSKAFWECTIKQLASGGFHTYGSCRMGQNPKDSVVNHNLIVHGIKNLRVIDASVLREISGYPVSYLFAISARAIDLIKAKYNA